MKKNHRVFHWIAIFLLVIIMAVFNYQPTDYSTQNAAGFLPQPTLKVAIKQSFQKGDVDILYPHFDEIISICIEDEEEIFLAYNAKAALINFFITNPPEKFELSHSGKSEGGKKAFWIGDYSAKNGIQMRIYILTEQDLIQEIEISSKRIAS